MQKLAVLLLSIFSTTVMAETLLLVEQNEKEIHFVYPEFEVDNAFYYAVWSANKNSCQEIDSDSKPLLLNDVEHKFYRASKVSGYLCLHRSKSQLGGEWNQYKIMLDESFLMPHKLEMRGVGSSPPEELTPETKSKLLPCEFDVKSDLEMCDLELQFNK